MVSLILYHRSSIDTSEIIQSIRKMASNPPSACCLKKTDHEGTSIGSHSELHGLNTYITGDLKSKRLIVVLTDIYGNKFNNVLLLADAFGRAGYKVYIPDILQGDDAVQGETDLAAWLPNHSAEITRPFVDSFLEKLGNSDEEVEFLGLVGYCFGAKYVIQQLTSNTKVTAGAVAHPSFVTIEEVAAIEKPILISAAEIDSIFTEDLRHLTESKLKEIGVDYQIDLFGGVTHGFAVKGDISIPKVKYAKEKAFSDHVYWFNYHSGAI